MANDQRVSAIPPSLHTTTAIATQMDQKLEVVGHHKHALHCLVLPYPVQGHLNPMLQFSKRLAHKGVRITLAVTKRLLNTTSPEQFPAAVSVETISDGYDDVVSGDLDFLLKLGSFERVGRETLAELLERLGNSERHVDCVIYDPFLPWGHEVAKEFGMLAAAFFTQASCVNSIYYRAHKGELKLPLSERDHYSVPGLGVALEIGDMPSFLQDLNSYGGGFKLLLKQFRNVEKDDFVFVNSVYELEQEVTNQMAERFPVKTIGPTIPSAYLDKRLLDDKEYDLSIFKPVDDCLKWLDDRQSKSVIYVSFGSMATPGEEQTEEIAQALRMTNRHFLWVVRASETSKLPIDFARETSDKGLVVPWSPQLEVLSHDAVGCFVTHCGWNSTLEALSLGVPMVAAPWWSDQPTNAKLVMDVWEIGITARADEKNVIRRDEIVRCVEHVMEMEGGGKMIRENARKWKEITRKAVDVGGSSDRNIEEFVSTLGALPHK